MPELFRYNGFVYFIWVNEGDPVEPINIHVSRGESRAGSDKFWLSRDGYFVPDKQNNILRKREAARVIENMNNNRDIGKLKTEWMKRFGEIRYFDE